MSAEGHRLALPTGYRLEEFRVERMLGKGGFGITYLAEDLHLKQRVAIKEHLPDVISTRADGSTVVAQSVPLEEDYRWSLESFVEEARVLASIRHPNVVRVSRLLEANGTAYMVMDYLEGESLDAYLARTPAGIREERLLAIVLPILEGLEAVHRSGLLHRDVKPANIYLTEEGRPILLDFGAARQDLGRTITMTSMVSHGYSPIEQYQTKARQSAGTDLYALSAVMYRAITGEKPPVASDRIFTDELRPIRERVSGQYCEGFLRAIDHALAVALEDRPNSVASWREELVGSENRSESLPDLELSHQRETPRTVEGAPDRADDVAAMVAAILRSRGVRAMVVLLVVVLVGLGAYHFMPRSGNETLANSELGRGSDPGESENGGPPVAVSTEGWLSVASDPEGANLFINGERHGVTPISRLKLNAGRYRLELRHSEYETLAREVEIEADEELGLGTLGLVLLAAQERFVPGYQGWNLEYAKTHAERGDLIAILVLVEHYERTGSVVELDKWRTSLELVTNEDPSQLVAKYRDGMDELLELGQGEDPFAAYLLGMAYLNPPFNDPPKASQWLRKAANEGNSSAQFTLGGSSWAGVVLGVGDVEKLEWVRMAADSAHVEAEYALGSFYSLGRLGLERDKGKAGEWYRKAAEKGHAQAQTDLGRNYFIGMPGFSRDPVEAVRWFRKAAEQGFADGQFRLALKYKSGLGVSKDLVEALKWYILASPRKQYYADQAEQLKQELSPNEVAEAMNRAEAFRTRLGSL